MKTSRGMAAGRRTRAHRMAEITGLAALVLLFSALTATEGLSSRQSDKSVFEWAFIRLEYLRDDRMNQLRQLCDRIHRKASVIADDEFMIAFFETARSYYDLLASKQAPQELTDSFAKLRETVQQHYVRHYFDFYNILMIDTRGHVIHSVRTNPAYGDNLFSARLAGSALTRCLAMSRSSPTEAFVDFHHDHVSGEPAAFFIEPLIHHGIHRGWFVLQWALNKINALFAGSEALGLSGETFLVNTDGCMLTESSFRSDSTILKQHLAESNVRAKFEAGKGRKIVTDYRGVTALTAFGVFDFLGASWLVVAKVDEAQVLTAHFTQHRRYYHDAIAEYLRCHRQQCRTCSDNFGERPTLRVDMDEFIRANQRELLRTYGVSTCTALIAAYPAKFGYLAHVSPYDRIHGGTGTNLVGHVLKKIKTYDIYKYERSRVRFAIVAQHLDSLPQIVDKLVDEGFHLSQIDVFHQPDAASADVTFDYITGRTLVEWRTADHNQKAVFQTDKEATNLGTIIRAAL